LYSSACWAQRLPVQPFEDDAAHGPSGTVTASERRLQAGCAFAIAGLPGLPAR
jgi:hypothetical protein